jgi:hypothetical protein
MPRAISFPFVSLVGAPGYLSLVLIIGLLVFTGCVEPLQRPENLTPSVPSELQNTFVPVSERTLTTTPTPSPTLEPTATPEPPTPTPTTTPTATSTVVQQPVETPTPTVTPTETPTVFEQPTETPIPTPTLSPSPTLPPGPELFIDVLGPAEGAVLQSESIVVYGNTSPLATLTINGAPVTVSQSGRFQREVTLSLGQNDIDIVATDHRGDQEQVILTVTLLQPQPFVLLVLEPEDQIVVRRNNVQVKGLTSPDAVVTINGVTVDVTSFGGVGIFDTTVLLVSGPNFIEVLATNSRGEVLSTVLAVIYSQN